ncbi:MAG: nucleotidyltransferase family protein, partial [Rhodanobacteraceae bacterium]|nr:nucleotidyltransferase family protein [Rhodanobacteraceae bacterium]
MTCWSTPEHRLLAHALTAAGLRSDGYSQHDHASQQATYHDPETDRHIDLHWALNVLPEISGRFDFAELDAESIELPALPGARAFCRKHALMHAVVHFHAHLPANERPAVWLYDMVLLAQGLGAAGWAQLDASVRKAGLAGLHAHALRQAAHWFPLDLPEDLMQQWQVLGQGECASHLLGPENSPARRLVHSLGCVNPERPHRLPARQVVPGSRLDARAIRHRKPRTTRQSLPPPLDQRSAPDTRCTAVGHRHFVERS